MIPPIADDPKQQKSFTLPNLIENTGTNKFILPITTNAVNQAKIILKGQGLGLLKAKFFVIDQKKAREEGQEAGTYDKVSWMGTPVFDTVTLQMDAYKDENGKDIPKTEIILDIAMLDVLQPKNIVLTKIAGKSGTVKEYMSDGDYHIVINSKVASELLSASPIKELKEIAGPLKAPIALHVNSAFLNDVFGITDIVIMEWGTKQIEGERNVIDLKLECLSDTPFEIQAADPMFNVIPSTTTGNIA